MKSSAFKALCAVACVAMVVALAVSAALGGCDTLIECDSGSFPMKCHWTFVAETFVSIIGIVACVLAFIATTKEGRRIACCALLITCAVMILLPTSAAIGLCSNAAMQCHTSANVVWVASIVAAIISVVLYVKADPAAAELPKMKL